MDALQVPRTSRSSCQKKPAQARTAAICCHDRRPRSPTFAAPPAAVLLDGDGIGGGYFCAASCGSDSPGPHLGHRQYPEQPENRAFYKDCETWASLSSYRRAASQTSLLVIARSTPCKMSSRLKVSLSSQITTTGGFVVLQCYHNRPQLRP